MDILSTPNNESTQDGPQPRVLELFDMFPLSRVQAAYSSAIAPAANVPATFEFAQAATTGETRPWEYQLTISTPGRIEQWAAAYSILCKCHGAIADYAAGDERALRAGVDFFGVVSQHSESGDQQDLATLQNEVENSTYAEAHLPQIRQRLEEIAGTPAGIASLLEASEAELRALGNAIDWNVISMIAALVAGAKGVSTIEIGGQSWPEYLQRLRSLQGSTDQQPAQTLSKIAGERIFRQMATAIKKATQLDPLLAFVMGDPPQEIVLSDYLYGLEIWKASRQRGEDMLDASRQIYTKVLLPRQMSEVPDSAAHEAARAELYHPYHPETRKLREAGLIALKKTMHYSKDGHALSPEEAAHMVNVLYGLEALTNAAAGTAEARERLAAALRRESDLMEGILPSPGGPVRDRAYLRAGVSLLLDKLLCIQEAYARLGDEAVPASQAPYRMLLPFLRWLAEERNAGRLPL